ncbi:acetyl-CoA synthetase-like protein [Xylariaceae sp. AK1471]|nr:acetyl-CoA synthetase-like protein [Xylariaceae sp. AK1471]
MPGLLQKPFKRPIFTPRTPAPASHGQQDENTISSLPDLIRFNAKHNHSNVFCLQAESENTSQAQLDGVVRHYSAREITFKSLEWAVASCARWISNNVPLPGLDSEVSSRKPIALFLESDVGLFIHLAALLAIDIPVLLISARLSVASIRHLLQSTGTDVLLVSQRTRRTLDEFLNDSTDVKTVVPYHTFITDTNTSVEESRELLPSRKVDEANCNVLILHSSGTTGYPKPIYLAHRYLLGYAACHQFSAEENIDWLNLSTLPLYHGFGLLAPCLSLSVGLTTCFPPSSIIPAAHSTLNLIKTFECRSLMTVPSIMDDILSRPKEETDSALKTLATLHFLAIGGGALNPEHGGDLVENNVKLLNHYGVTEIGAIAPIFCPGPDYNWRFLRLRTDLGLELHPIPDTPYFRLVGFPCGWDNSFEVQDQLEQNPDSKYVEVRILGRTDDVLVLKTGEKVMPQKLEDILNRDPNIHAAVCVGTGRFEIAVIVQPVNEDTIDPASMIDYIWKHISDINPSLDSHARVSSKQSIIIKPIEKTIPRSDKGSVMRREVCEVFGKEIDDAYTAMESSVNGVEISLNPNDIGLGIRAAADAILSRESDMTTIGGEEDFFEFGMDSMQAVRLARSLDAALRRVRSPLGNSFGALTAEFVYRHPSIQQLVTACSHILSGEGMASGAIKRDAASDMHSLVDEYMDKLTGTAARIPKLPPYHVVLLTGATGTLGTHTLAQLARTSSVRKIVCLVRRQGATVSAINPVSDKDGHSLLMDKLHRAMETQGLTLTPTEWTKVKTIGTRSLFEKTDESDQPERDTPQDIVARLASEVTHICHLAWPMDFKRTLQSFRPHIDFLCKLLELALYAKAMQPHAPPVRLLFASSIAVLRYQSSPQSGETNSSRSGPMVLETAIDSPSAVTPMGYAEAKWVCERILDQAGQTHKIQVDPIVVRIGQISGPARTQGTWKTSEHVPALVRASQVVGAFPSALGKVSWLPTDHAARSLTEILFCNGDVNRFLHLENPIRQPMQDIATIMGNELGLARPYTIPFDQWIERASGLGVVESLEDFFKNHYQELAQGSVILDTAHCRSVSKTLRGQSAVEKDLLAQYVKRWRCEGFLK